MGSGRFVGSVLSPGGGRREWGVQLQFCGVHWVAADAGLARALLRAPLRVAVVRQQALVGGRSRGGGGGGGEVVEVPLGAADIDLSGLLTARPGRDPTTRCGGLPAALLCWRACLHTASCIPRRLLITIIKVDCPYLYLYHISAPHI